jgi:hypothetical protein
MNETAASPEEESDLPLDAREAAAVILSPWADPPDWRCAVHSEHPAALRCSRCGAGLCRECLLSLPEPQSLVCSTCRPRLGTVSVGVWRALRLPIFWVLICILAAGAAWQAGVGNPDLARLAAEDGAKPWQVQRPGRLMIEKAGREQQRAAVLRLQGEHEAARPWSRRAAASFRAAADYWPTTPVTADLRIAAATADGDADDPAAGLAALLAMDAPADHNTALARRYRLGLMAAAAGRNDLAKAALSEVAASDPAALAAANFDSLLDRFAGNRREAEMTAMVRAVCGTDRPPAEMIRDARQRLHLPAEDESGDVIAPTGLPAPVDSRTDPESTFEIERLD